MAKQAKRKTAAQAAGARAQRKMDERRTFRAATVDSVQSQRQRYYALKKQGYSSAEAAEVANKEAGQAPSMTAVGSLPRKSARARVERPAPAAGLAARSAVLKGREIQHDPTKTRTPKAGRVARMMTPDADELGTHEEAETEFVPAFKHTHEGRSPPKQEVDDADSYHQGNEAVNAGDSAEASKALRGGRAARMDAQAGGAGGSAAKYATNPGATVPDDWESLSYARKRALARDLTGTTPGTQNQADAVLRREHRKQRG